MHVVAVIAAAVLALVFVRAGVAKINRQGATATAFGAMRLPAPRALARAVPILELALAVTLVANPRLGGVLALVLIAIFSAVLVRAVDTETGCGCFGAAHSRPVSGVDLLRNAVLAGLAFLAVLASSL